jgi:hypothetical protein
VRHSCGLHQSLTTFLVLWSCALFPHFPAFANEPSDAPLPFACEVRYHFREHFPDARPGEKDVSAPSFEREGLPISRVAILDGVAERIVEGCVTHLPFQFSVKVSQQGDNEPGILEVNVLDSSGKSLTGFPKVMPNPLTKTGDSSRTEFELPVGSGLKKKIAKSLLAKNQFITYVDLIVGMDDDFLSAYFPND